MKAIKQGMVEAENLQLREHFCCLIFFAVKYNWEGLLESSGGRFVSLSQIRFTVFKSSLT